MLGSTEQKSAGATTASPSKLVLYSYWQSSCSWRIRFALSLKGISYEYKAVDLLKAEQFSPEFERLNPLHYVPVLVDNGVVISDSYAIFLYLEEKYTQKPLLPVDPQLRAFNLQVASIINSSLQPLHMLGVLKDLQKMFAVDPQVWAKYTIDKGFTALEKLLKDFAGTYATGEDVYMVVQDVTQVATCNRTLTRTKFVGIQPHMKADVFLAPQITASLRFNIDLSKFPTLSRLYETYKALPEFQVSSPEGQPDACKNFRLSL